MNADENRMVVITREFNIFNDWLKWSEMWKLKMANPFCRSIGQWINQMLSSIGTEGFQGSW